MVIYNWMGAINGQLTQEYKSGNARKLKVSHRNYDLSFIKLQFSSFARMAICGPEC